MAALYTQTLKTLCDTIAGNETYSGYTNIYKLATNNTVLDTVFLKEYTALYDYKDNTTGNDYKKSLFTKILLHYMLYELGQETAGYFIYCLNERLIQIMPYYNDMLNSTLLKFDPLQDTNFTRLVTSSSKNENNNVISFNENYINKQIGKESDTPQGGIENLEQDRYISYARINSDDNKKIGNNTTNANGNASGTTKEHIIGMQKGNFAEAIKQYRNIIINVDNMIIDNLGNLFMGVM